MAKPKCSVMVKRLSTVLAIYCDHHEEQASEIKAIEGVSSVTIFEEFLLAAVDPRYDLDEVADEVEVMLMPVEIPEVFRDWGHARPIEIPEA